MKSAEGVTDCATERDAVGRVEREVVGKREALVDTERVRVSVVEAEGDESWDKTVEGLAAAEALTVEVMGCGCTMSRRALGAESTKKIRPAASMARLDDKPLLKLAEAQGTEALPTAALTVVVPPPAIRVTGLEPPKPILRISEAPPAIFVASMAYSAFSVGL